MTRIIEVNNPKRDLLLNHPHTDAPYTQASSFIKAQKSAKGKQIKEKNKTEDRKRSKKEREINGGIENRGKLFVFMQEGEQKGKRSYQKRGVGPRHVALEACQDPYHSPPLFLLSLHLSAASHQPLPPLLKESRGTFSLLKSNSQRLLFVFFVFCFFFFWPWDPLEGRLFVLSSPPSKSIKSVRIHLAQKREIFGLSFIFFWFVAV